MVFTGFSFKRRSVGGPEFFMHLEESFGAATVNVLRWHVQTRREQCPSGRTDQPPHSNPRAVARLYSDAIK